MRRTFILFIACVFAQQIPTIELVSYDLENVWQGYTQQPKIDYLREQKWFISNILP